MKLREITAEDRKREKLGEAIGWELDFDHMGGSVGKRTATLYMSDGLLLELHDLTDAAATVARETVSDALWAKLDAIVVQLYTSGLDEMDLRETLRVGMYPTEAENVVAEAEKWRGWGEARGAAQGLAYAIALLANPRRPNVDWVREEAARRYEASAS